MSFEEAIATQPSWVRWWLNWMGIVIIGSIVILLISKITRRDSIIILATSVIVFLCMTWLYQEIGYVRLLGIVHVVIWTPLAIYFWQRLKNPAIVAPFRQVISVFLVTIVVSLLLDYADVVRYLLGERESLVPS
jgi:hypothetical protein